MGFILQTDSYSQPLEEVKLGRLTIEAADATVAATAGIHAAQTATGPCTARLVAASAVTDILDIAFVATQADDPAGVITFKLTAAADDVLACEASDTTGVIWIKLAKTTPGNNTAAAIQTIVRAVTPGGGVQGIVKGISVAAVVCTAGGNWDAAAVAPGANMTSVACVGGGGETVITGITQPSVPRNISATSGGTGADIGAVAVIIYGTNQDDQPISETLTAFTVNQAATKAGAKAFKTVTSIFFPSHDGIAATVAIGYGEILGFPMKLTKRPLCWATLAGVIEATAPTITVDSDEIEKNTFDLSSNLNSSEVCLYLGLPEA